jgi:excisionase family DNA binding protein
LETSTETAAPIFNEVINQKLLRDADVAKILDISRAMAYRLMQQGEIRTVRIAGSRRVRVMDLDEYINENLYPPPAQAREKL